MSKKKLVKDTFDFSYLQNISSNESEKYNFVSQYLPSLLHSGIGKILKGVKNKGMPAFEIIKMLALFPFLGMGTVHGLYESQKYRLFEVQKDVFYRLKNNSLINWRRIVLSVSMRFLRLAGGQINCLRTETGEGQNKEEDLRTLPKCLIFDDTDIEKTGFKIEGVSKIWSHVYHRYILGFKCLTLGFFDGVSFIGLDFSLHREQVDKQQQYGLKNSQRKQQYVKQRDKKEPGYERKLELNTKKTKSILKMMSGALKHLNKLKNGLGRVEYVLCDSWFFSEELLHFCQNKKLFLACGVKMGKITFEYNEKNYSPKALVKITQRKSKFSKKMKAHYIPLIVSYKGTRVKLFFVKYRGQEKWRLILCSNTKLTFIKTMEIYQIRWSIEVFFKEMKQYLGLNKCQSRHFEAHIAHISIAMILHQALTLKKRVENHATIGQLFRSVKNQMIEMTIVQKLWKLFLKLIRKLTLLFEFEPYELFKKLLKNDVNSFNDIFALE